MVNQKNIAMGLQLKKVLREIGFKESDESWNYNFGNWQLSGFETLFLPFYHFVGSYHTRRESGRLEFKLPLLVGSFEEGVAILENAAGGMRTGSQAGRSGGIAAGYSGCPKMDSTNKIMAYLRRL